MANMSGTWYVNIEHGGSFRREYNLVSTGDLFAGSGTEIWAPHPGKSDVETLAGRVIYGETIEAYMVRDDNRFGGVFSGTFKDGKIVGELTTPRDGVQSAVWLKAG